MGIVTRPPMTVDQFLLWHEQRPETEHYELVAGEVVAMAAERWGHNSVKFLIWQALRNAVMAADLPCDVAGDGMTVKIDEWTAYEPDVVIHSGEPLTEDDIIVPNPVVVVEVLSPATKGRDAGAKLADYFRVESIEHYLLVDAKFRRITHHSRRDHVSIDTNVLTGGQLQLDPPGITVDCADFFAVYRR